MNPIQIILWLVLVAMTYAFPVSVIQALSAMKTPTQRASGDLAQGVDTHVEPGSPLSYVIIVFTSIILGVSGIYYALRIAIWLACKMDDRKREREHELARIRAENAASTGGQDPEDQRA